MRVVKAKNRLDFVNKFGIFASSLLVTAIAVYVWSPVLGSNADDAVFRVSIKNSAVISLTLDTNNLNFSIAPTDSGVFSSQAIMATVTTNSQTGYELYFSSEDNSTDMTANGATTIIASDFEGTVTSTTMAKDKWGYSLDDTDFSKIPTLDNQATIRNVNHTPSAAEKITPIYIGTKVSSNLQAGRYAKNVEFSAIAHEVPEPPFGDIWRMQDMTAEICAAASVGDTTTLTDIRDGNSYTVKKLADGRCWMTQNLRIADKTITSADSNLLLGESFTIPASDETAFVDFYGFNSNATYIDETYGSYYTFYTATAGWGIDDNGDGSNAPKDICPKGWRLPTGGPYGDYQTLYNNYNSTELMQGVPGFTLSGYVSNKTLRYKGEDGRYWSSTTGDGYLDVNYMFLDEFDVVTDNETDRYRGHAVRCIVKGTEPTTMQTFNKSTMLLSTHESAQIKDERDGNFYTVNRLADGNVWMTENLRIVDKTIDSSDSNLPSGESWTIPASDLSSFTTWHDRNTAYFDPAYGGYYSFYTATAGWGSSSVTSGNAPKDICPKSWRLPIGGDAGEFQALYDKYVKDDDSTELVQGNPSFAPLSGIIQHGNVMWLDGPDGLYWSSSVYDKNRAYAMYLYSVHGGGPANVYDTLYGLSVRCIAK